MRQNHPIKENSEPLIGYSAGDSSNRDNNLKKNRASPSSTQASRDRYNSASNSPLGLCSEHFRPLEIYCLEPECIDLVCANCALFGKHKGHKVKEQSELDKETKEMVDDLESVHRDLKAAEAEILAKESVNAWANRLKSELIAKEEDIHRFFDNAIERLEELREDTVKTLKQQVEDQINGVYHCTELPSELTHEVDLWKQKYFHVMKS